MTNALSTIAGAVVATIAAGAVVAAAGVAGAVNGSADAAAVETGTNPPPTVIYEDGSGITYASGVLVAMHDAGDSADDRRGWYPVFGSEWKPAPKRWIGLRFDLIGGGTKEVTRRALVNVGPTTYVIWPHSNRIGTS